jgi:hypothetical protein
MTKPQSTISVGITLIVIVGLVNFHIPHFLLEGRTEFSAAEYLLEFILLVNVIAALIAAFGIYRGRRWGWVLGIGVSVFSAFLWLAQETVGLPGLPQQWFEPSRIASFVVEASFVAIACRYLHWRQHRVN